VDFFEAVAGEKLKLAMAPAGKTLGIPSNLLFVLHANLCARRAFQICFPGEFLKERNVGTYCCEGYFSTLVVSNGGHKPTAPQAYHLTNRAALVAEIRNMLGRPFFESISSNQSYDYSDSALTIAPTKITAWNDGSNLNQIDRSRESGKKRKGISAEKHVVADVPVRDHHKKLKTM
jgi:hypothetical protein